ncbi:DUF948 domain-containing protein [Virgibacillus halodenitrificans]|nr:DUF948 domain-containing protein [Virgibacillus halodenitrificans]
MHLKEGVFPMEGIIYVALLLISIAFAIIVAYTSFLLYRISKTMKTMAKTVNEVEKEVEALTPRLKETIYETDKIVDDIGIKLKSTDNLFDTVENVGSSMNAVNETIHNSSDKLSKTEMERKTKPFVEGIKWSEVAFTLYSKWKKKSKNEVMVQNQSHSLVPLNKTGKEG